MNKKLKLGLLASLFTGSILAITLPIVSCSGSTPALTVKKSADFQNQITAATTKINTALKDANFKAATTYAEQKAKYDSIIKNNYVNTPGDLDDIEKSFDFFNANGEEIGEFELEIELDVVLAKGATPLPETRPTTPIKIPDLWIIFEIDLEIEFDANDSEYEYENKLGVPISITATTLTR